MEWVKKVFGHFLAIFWGQIGPKFPISINLGTGSYGCFNFGFAFTNASPGGYANFNLRVYLIVSFITVYVVI